MKILLDTHVFLWYLAGDSKLPPAFQTAIRDTSNEVFVSAASIWEAVVKYAIGKRPLPAPPADYLPRNRIAHGFSPLPIDEAAMIHLEVLPPIHRDPFDRILIAQALQNDMTLATVDAEFNAYPAKLLARH